MAVQNASAAARITTASWIYGITGLLLVGAFVWWEGRAAEPIIPLQLFKNRVFTVANALGFITGMVMFGALIFLPQYFQRVRGIARPCGPAPVAHAGRHAAAVHHLGAADQQVGPLQGVRGVRDGRPAAGLAWMTTITITTSGWVLAAMLFVVGSGSACSCRR